MYYQALDPSRLEMPINKIEVFVYSSDDSAGNKKSSSSGIDNAAASTGAVSELQLKRSSQ